MEKISLNPKDDGMDGQLTEILSKLDKEDRQVLLGLKKLYEYINNDKMDLSKVKDTVTALTQFNKRQQYNYLNNLLHPEKCKGVKIPSPIPVPSCSFQLHNCVTLSTNASGNLAFIFNPFFLYKEFSGSKNFPVTFNDLTLMPDGPGVASLSSSLTTLWVNNDDTLTGYSSNSRWKGINIGQGIPDVYDQYRLVSASIVVKYIGRLDIVSGVIGGAIVYEDDKNIGTGAVSLIQGGGTPPTIIPSHGANPSLAKFGNFDLAMDSYYHQENITIEGIKQLYFPIDNSYEEYVKLATSNDLAIVNNTISNDSPVQFNITNEDVFRTGFNNFVYVLGAPPSSACFKVDIYCNFECLPNAKFLNYLPLSMGTFTLSNEEKKNAITIIQNKPIMKLEEEIDYNKMPNIWEKMEKKFKNSLPSIPKLISLGAIPAYKPGIALANSMISSQMEEEVD